MTRYEEIMDHIEVTEEMRGRILTNIDRQMRRAGGARRTRRRRKARAVRTWIPILAAAAVLLVVCSVTLGVDRGNRTSSSPDTAAQMESAAVTADTAPTVEEDAASANVADASEAVTEAAGDTDSALDSSADMAAATYAPEMYNSAEELAEAVGFEIQDLTSIPFAVGSIEYYAIDDLAEIDYRSMGNVCTLTYRKSPGTDDNSGDYSDYEFVEDAAIGDNPLTLKGNGERYYLATWTDGTYAYSIYVSDGCSHEEMLAVIEETQ